MSRIGHWGWMGLEGSPRIHETMRFHLLFIVVLQLRLLPWGLGKQFGVLGFKKKLCYTFALWGRTIFVSKPTTHNPSNTLMNCC